MQSVTRSPTMRIMYRCTDMTITSPSTLYSFRWREQPQRRQAQRLAHARACRLAHPPVADVHRHVPLAPIAEQMHVAERRARRRRRELIEPVHDEPGAPYVSRIMWDVTVRVPWPPMLMLGGQVMAEDALMHDSLTLLGAQLAPRVVVHVPS